MGILNLLSRYPDGAYNKNRFTLQGCQAISKSSLTFLFPIVLCSAGCPTLLPDLGITGCLSLHLNKDRLSLTGDLSGTFFITTDVKSFYVLIFNLCIFGDMSFGSYLHTLDECPLLNI